MQHAPILMAAVSPREIDRALSWRVGRLAFEDETLGSAAAKFARYSEVKIEISDPEVAKQTVTGLFVSNDPIGFCNAVAASLGLQSQVSDNVVRLSR
jgi:transmembrane sensor